MKNLIKRIIKEAINRSFSSMNDLASYRDINLDSPSSLSRVKSSKGLKASNVSDSRKNIPFDAKMGNLYKIMLGYISNKFKLKRNSSDLIERGKEISNFIKNFLTRDEVEKFYYRLSRFSSNSVQFKRICEQLLNYMESGQLSDIDVYDKIDMGDEDFRDAYKVSPISQSAMLEDQMNKLRDKIKPIREKVGLIKNILNSYTRYKPLDKKDVDNAISNNLIDSNAFRVKVSALKTGGVNRERDVFLSMLNTTLQDYNDELKYLEGVFINTYYELRDYKNKFF